MKFIHFSFEDYAFPSPDCFFLIGALSSREFVPSTCPIASIDVGAVEASSDGLRNACLPQRSTYSAEADVEPRSFAAQHAILVSHLFATLGVA